MRYAIGLLLLCGCAREPDLAGFEQARIVAFAHACAENHTTDHCVEACGAVFPDNATDDNQRRWLICVSALALKQEVG